MVVGPTNPNILNLNLNLVCLQQRYYLVCRRSMCSRTVFFRRRYEACAQKTGKKYHYTISQASIKYIYFVANDIPVMSVFSPKNAYTNIYWDVLAQTFMRRTCHAVQLPTVLGQVTGRFTKSYCLLMHNSNGRLFSIYASTKCATT